MKLFPASRRVSSRIDGFEIRATPDHDRDLFGHFLGVSLQVGRPLTDPNHFIAMDGVLTWEEAESLGLRLLHLVKKYGEKQCPEHTE